MNPVRLNYELSGPEDAPTLVFSNSLGTTLAMWDDQMPLVEGKFRVLRYDQRGHGKSEVPDGPYSIADLGGDLISLLDELGVERFSFCGLSVGGMVGMWVASEYPDRIERLVLACTSPLLGPPEMWDERIETARTKGVSAMTETVLQRWFTPAIDERRPDARRRTAAMLDGTPGEGYAGVSEAIRDMDLRDRLKDITAPTLVIGGAEDPSTPPEEHGRLIHEGISGSRMAVIPSAAHLANIEQTEAFDEAMIGHLEGGS